MAGVFLFHLNPHKVPQGYLGVIGFFVLAGYLSMRQLRGRGQRLGFVSSVRSSLGKKIAKLYPAMSLMLFVISLFMLIIFPQFLDHFAAQLRSAVLSGNNIWQIINGDSYFQGAGYLKPLTHLWALSLEFQFYIFFTFSAESFYREKDRYKWMIFFVILSLLSFLAMIMIYQPGEDPTRVYYGTDTRFFSFTLGALFALINKDKVANRLSKEENQQISIEISEIRREVIGWFIVVPMIYLYFVELSMDTMIYYVFIFYSLIYCLLLLCWDKNTKSLSEGLGRTRLIRYLASRSYAIYLWHYPVFKIVERLSANYRIPLWLLFLTQIAFSIFLAELFTMIILAWKDTASIDRAKHRTVSQQAVAFALSILMLVLPWGKIYEWTGGKNFHDLNAKIASQESRMEEKRNTLIKETKQNEVTSSSKSLSSTDNKDVMNEGQDVPTSLNITGSKVTSKADNKHLETNVNSDNKYISLTQAPILSEEEKQSLILVEETMDYYQRMYGRGYTIDFDQYERFRHLPVTMIGDSVSVIASYYIEPYWSGLYLDALSNRQTDDLPAVYNSIKNDGLMGEILVIALGTNGDIDLEALETVYQDLNGKPLLLVSIVLPYTQEENMRNEALRTFAAEHENVWMVEWYDHAKGVAEYFLEDAIHPSGAGCEAFCQLITAKLVEVLSIYEQQSLLKPAL